VPEEDHPDSQDQAGQHGQEGVLQLVRADRGAGDVGGLHDHTAALLEGLPGLEVRELLLEDGQPGHQGVALGLELRTLRVGGGSELRVHVRQLRLDRVDPLPDRLGGGLELIERLLAPEVDVAVGEGVGQGRGAVRVGVPVRDPEHVGLADDLDIQLGQERVGGGIRGDRVPNLGGD
jgi:hypothetical protein